MNVIAWLDSLYATDADGSITNGKWPEAQEARATVEAMAEALCRLDAWNKNVNGDGTELGEICIAAESVMARFHGGA